jgi:malonyl CoA-acyl carrier protein transacylase
MKAYLFPGQGAQHRGMGQTCFGQFPQLVARADAVLGYSLQRLCSEDPDNKLSDTRFTQPALYVVNILTHLASILDDPDPPAFFAGHSVGEYSALYAAGALEFEGGLRLVKQRAEAMAACGSGAMAAVIGCPAGRLPALLEHRGLAALDIANFNSPQQQVVAGPVDEIQRAKGLLAREVRALVRLNVSGAFHSRYMRSAREAFEPVLRAWRFTPLRIPVISNADARPYPEGQVATLLARQLEAPVRWADSMAYLIEQGVTDFVEVGPGNVLKKLMVEIAGSKPGVSARSCSV